MTNWTTLLGSAVIAALLASILNNLFLYWLQRSKQSQSLKGVLLQADCATRSFLNALRRAQWDRELLLEDSLSHLTDVMLSAEFTRATAQLELEPVYDLLVDVDYLTGDLAKVRKSIREDGGPQRIRIADRARYKFDDRWWEQRRNRAASERSLLMDLIMPRAEQLHDRLEYLIFPQRGNPKELPRLAGLVKSSPVWQADEY